jgi:hypothetical protein
MEVLGCSPVEGESINEATPAELARVAPLAPPNGVARRGHDSLRQADHSPRSGRDNTLPHRALRVPMPA